MVFFPLLSELKSNAIITFFPRLHSRNLFKSAYADQCAPGNRTPEEPFAHPVIIYSSEVLLHGYNIILIKNRIFVNAEISVVYDHIGLTKVLMVMSGTEVICLVRNAHIKGVVIDDSIVDSYTHTDICFDD